MALRHEISIDGRNIRAGHGELLLDAALRDGIDLPYDCRAGHCGTCCVRLVSGSVRGGAGAEPGIVHACQARVVGDAVIERRRRVRCLTVNGRLNSLRPLSREIMEVGIGIDGALPHHAGQYAHVRFAGYPSRPFSITHPLSGHSSHRQIWFHVRRMRGGRVTAALGQRIRPGHSAQVTGPYGSAHFRRNLDQPLILVATNTGFAPIWSIAAAALHENPDRAMTIIAGGRALDSLYMFPALAQLSRFRNVRVAPVCSSLRTTSGPVMPGRPTDYLPRLRPTDILHVCGAPALVGAVKAIAADAGAVCHADPFLPTVDDKVGESALSRAVGWLAAQARRRIGSPDAAPAVGSAARRAPVLTISNAGVTSHHRS